jgi:hypothetical protein
MSKDEFADYRQRWLSHQKAAEKIGAANVEPFLEGAAAERDFLLQGQKKLSVPQWSEIADRELALGNARLAAERERDRGGSKG